VKRGTSVWLRILAGTALALASLVLLVPARPGLRVPVAPAGVVGAAAGLTLYLVVARRRPCLPPGSARVRVLACKWALLGLLAANEEVVWRRAVLGEFLRAGSTAAVAGSTVIFALAHRARPGLHVGTGAAFGGLYLATGALISSIAAHWTYNLLLSTLADRQRPMRGAAP